MYSGNINQFGGEIQPIAFNFVYKEIVINLQAIGLLFGHAHTQTNTKKLFMSCILRNIIYFDVAAIVAFDSKGVIKVYLYYAKWDFCEIAYFLFIEMTFVRC